MKHSTLFWLAPIALLLAAPASADFSQVFLDPCDGCTYLTSPDDVPVPPNYPTASTNPLYYGGAGDVVGGEESFDVLSMSVSQTGGNLVVNIITRFAEYADSPIKFGDLMIATGDVGQTWKPNGGSAPYTTDNASTSETHWNYVVDTHTHTLYKDQAGSELQLLNSDDAPTLHGELYRANHYIKRASGGVDMGAVSVAIDSVTLPDSLDGSTPTDGSSLTYTISLAALNISLVNPSEIALRWTMTCANDIVEAAVTLGQSVSTVPEPDALALVAVGIVAWGAVGIRRKVQHSDDG